MRRHEKLDRHGRPVVDDDGVLRDGQTLRVGMMMRDGLSPLQRAVAEDKAARGVTVVDGLGRPAGHRPGACYLRTVPHTVDHAVAVTQEHLRLEAHADSIRELCDAWKGNNKTTARSRVCTIPVMLFATVILTKSAISRRHGRAGGDDGHPPFA